MEIINEQYKDKCRYSDFRTTSIYDKITAIEYEKDGSCNIKMKSDYPSVFGFTFLKKV